MAGKSHFVSPKPGGWKVQRSGADRASGIFDTKKDAIDFGRDLSRRQHTELKIQNRDGKISQSDSHGKDPYPPKG